MENKTPDELVTLMKKLAREVGQISIKSDADFVGCSHGYVIEKIKMAKSTLDWCEKRIREIEYENQEVKPEPLCGNWDFGLRTECPHCNEDINVLDDIDDIWEGNTHIVPMDMNEYKTMDFDCPHCDEPVCITDFEY